MVKEIKLDLSNLYPEFAEATKISKPEEYATNPIFTEMNAQAEGRKLSRQIGDEEWLKGNTRYAFEAYEAACATPSEVLEKAKALLQSETLARLCRIEQDAEYQNYIINCSYLNIGVLSFQYCKKDDCVSCASRKVINRKYANKIYKLLNWTPPENPKDNTVEYDEYSSYVLAKNVDKYRSGAVAALKLVKRLNIIYIAKETETSDETKKS